MSFGNRRPGVPVEPPAVVRHVAVRLSDKESPRWIPITAEDAEFRWKELLGCLTEHVAKVKECYDDKAPATFVRPQDAAVARDSDYCVRGSCIVPVAGVEEKEGFRLRLRIDVHKEICSITYLFDAIRANGPADAALPKAMSQLPDETAAFDDLIDHIWREGGDGPRVARVAAPWLGGGGFGTEGRKIGRKLVDFRGVILHADPEAVRAGNPKAKSGEKDEFAERAPLTAELLPSIKTFASRHAELIRKAAGVGGDRPESGEPVVCGMLDGAALYASRLGRWHPQSWEIEPIRHLLVYAGESHEQLGRLVRRMHLLGQLRHAALMDFAYDEVAPIDQDVPMPALRMASDEMRALGQRLTEESATIAGRAEMPELEKAIPELVRISNIVEGGGLTYRVERARRYSSEFRDTIEHLRTVKLRDWVAYDDFAKRHILHLLDRVDHIGRRYEALSERVQRLLTFRYTRTVQDELRVIDESTAALNKTSENQEKLLDYAHSFAIMFSVYYVGTVFDHLYHVPGRLRFPHWLYYLTWAAIMGAAVIYVLAKRRIDALVRRLRGPPAEGRSGEGLDKPRMLLR